MVRWCFDVPVAGHEFDVVLTNPPCVPADSGMAASLLDDRLGAHVVRAWVQDRSVLVQPLEGALLR